MERLRNVRFIGRMIPSFLCSKRILMHASLLSLMGITVWQSEAAAGIDRSSLLYSFISGEEVVEGPLDPSAYAQTDGPGIGGSRLAAIDASDTDLITFDDPEVQFAETLGGNAVVAPLQPLVPEPGTVDEGDVKIKRPTIYTVQDGDTIASIAAKFDVSTNTILWANGLSSRTTIKVGDHITILPITGVLHTVAPGDTVGEIANKYDAKGKDIIAFNGLGDDGKLKIGQKIIIPDGAVAAPAQVPQIVPQGTYVADRDTEPGPTPEPATVIGAGWVWPTVTRHISQYFGASGHTGVDIDNRSRPAVFAAQPGTVQFAGWLGGYGNLIILDHGSGITTYYAHLEKFYVNRGQQVAKGSAVGKMGSTGHSTGPHVHFEVRKNGRPINPLGFF